MFHFIQDGPTDRRRDMVREKLIQNIAAKCYESWDTTYAHREKHFAGRILKNSVQLKNHLFLRFRGEKEKSKIQSRGNSRPNILFDIFLDAAIASL